MKPIIGIIGRPNYPGEQTPSIVTMEVYRKAIITNGGIPILIMPPKLIDYNNSRPSEVSQLTKEDKEIIKGQLKICDGILMPGGYKIFSHDFYILEYAIDNDVPILGICLGMQIMSNYKQDFYNEKNEESGLKHFDLTGNYCHTVTIKDDSKLRAIIGKDKIKVNSMHNYHATKGGLYNIVARSDDGLIEALELPNAKFNIGVQWHPERLDDESSYKLFKEFIKCSLG